MADVRKFLEQRRRYLRLSQQDVAERARVSEKTIRNYETQGLPNDRAQWDKLEAYARAIGITERGLNELIDGRVPLEKELFAPSVEGLRIVAGGSTMPAAFNLGIAASGWVEIAGEGRTENLRQRREGWVLIQVSGDSMEPRYRNGATVMFQLLNVEEGDAAQPGSDYFFVRNDGRGTFKRLVSASDDEYVMVALNEKYARKIHVARQEIVLIAQARFEVKELPNI